MIWSTQLYNFPCFRCPVDAIDKRLKKLLESSDTTQLYSIILDLIKHNHEHGANKGTIKKVSSGLFNG